MRQIQDSEAKTYLLQLLDDVERGETLVITRHGHPIARLVPEAEQRQREIEGAFASIRRREVAPKIEELLSARDEGRK